MKMATPTCALILLLAGVGADGLAVRRARAGDQPGDECTRLLERCWQAVLPVFALLRTPASVDMRTLYGRDEGFIQHCRNLDTETRRCLLKAGDVWQGFFRCQSRGSDLRTRLRPPRLTGLLRPELRPLSARRGRRLLAGLAGNWRHERRAARVALHWRINGNGEVEETWHGPTGRSKRRHFRLGLLDRQTLEVSIGEQVVQRWKLLRLSKNRLVIDRSGWGCWTRPSRRGDFTIFDEGYLVVVREGRCSLVEPRGRRHECRLHWSSRGRRRWLEVTWRKDPDGSPGGEQQLEYIKVGRLLVGRRTYQQGLFQRQPRGVSSP